jgi:hypothetical protein
VLDADLRAVDLAGVGRAAQLPGQLAALRESGGSERAALGDPAAGGIDDPAAAVRGVRVVDQLVAVALLGESGAS